MGHVLSIEKADRFLKRKGLLIDKEPCVLISHALIHIVYGDIERGIAETKELIERFGLKGTRAELFVLELRNDLISKVRDKQVVPRQVPQGIAFAAFIDAQKLEAVASKRNRECAGSEYGCDPNLLLDDPDTLYDFFVRGSKRGTRPKEQHRLGSQWARDIYGKIIRYHDRKAKAS